MLLSVTTLATFVLAQGIKSRPTGPARLSTATGLQRRDYTPSTSTDLIPLGSAASYAVFTLSGISTVQGTVAAGQVVNGDIGVAPIALTGITGFGAVTEGKSNTPFVTGNIHGPPYSTDTQTDVINAYNVATGKSPSGAIVTGAGSLDGGLIMTPGVYQWSGALALGVDEILTLNGQCGDIFIFQTGGAITTGGNSTVVLTGGLTASSVYWVSATSLNTGVASSFSGIILAKTNVVIAGTLVGAVYYQTETALHAATISAPVATLATTQIGSICNIAKCDINFGLLEGACVACESGYGSTGGVATCQKCTGISFINPLGACDACSTGTLSCDVNTGFSITCSEGYTGTSTTPCTKVNNLYSILVTDSNNNVQGYLSNQGEVEGWVRVQDPSEAMSINRPSSFLASDMPINLLSTTLGTKSGNDGNNRGQPGYGFSLAFAQNGGDNLECDGQNGGVLLTQSTTDNVAEYFNQANDWGGGNYAANSRVPPVTNVYIKSYGQIIYGDCDPNYNGEKDIFYLVPAVA